MHLRKRRNKQWLVYLELSDGDAQVGLIEAILNVPAKRTKLFAFLNQGMKKAQAEQQLLKILAVEKTDKRRVHHRRQGLQWFHG